jgi:hypothetical protein
LDGIPTKSDLSIADITHDAISSVLPYCPFNNNNNDNYNDNNKQSITTSNAAATTATKEETSSASSPPSCSSSSPSLEIQLLLKGIMKIPPSDKRFNFSSSCYDEDGNSTSQSSSSSSLLWTTDELEDELWMIVDEFLIATNKTKTISSNLLELRCQNNNKEEYYPNHRRQRRFSYSVAYLLESMLPIGITTTSTTGSTSAISSNNNDGRYSDNFRNGGRRYSSSSSSKSNDKATKKSSTTKGSNNADGGDHDSYNDYLMDINEIQQFRSMLLSIPSTRQRLRFVLETFYQWRFYL